MNITDPRFRYNNAASHDAGSQAFRDRQRERMRRAQGVPNASDAKIEELRKEAWRGRIGPGGGHVTPGTIFHGGNGRNDAYGLD